MEQNRTRTYIFYAVGEIALVMIGILLALQVNNWNEERKLKAEEVEILNILQEDLTTAKTQSEEFIESEERSQELLAYILSPDSIQIILNSERVDFLFYNAIWELNLQTPVISAYNDLKNAGKTGLISNPEIRKQLSSLDFRIYNLNSLLNDRLSVQQIRIDDIATKQVDFLQLMTSRHKDLPHIVTAAPNNYPELMRDEEVRNLLGIKLELTIANVKYRKELRDQINEVLSLLQSELATLENR